MGHWNYRLMRDGRGDDLRLVEAYYDDRNRVYGYVACDGSWLTFEDQDSAHAFVDHFAQALSRPVLYPSDLVETVEPR